MPHTKHDVTFLVAESHRDHRIQTWHSIASCSFVRAEKWATTELAHSVGRFAKNRPDVTFIADTIKQEPTLDAVRAIIKVDPQAFVVAMLSEPDMAMRTAMIEAGALGVIYKPFTQLTVHNVIASYLEYRKTLWSTDEKEIEQKLEPIQDTYRQVLTYLERETVHQHREGVR